MGWGSASTPPWVDEERIDAEKRKQKATEDAAKIEALERENQDLRNRIAQLEKKLKELKK